MGKRGPKGYSLEDKVDDILKKCLTGELKTDVEIAIYLKIPSDRWYDAVNRAKRDGDEKTCQTLKMIDDAIQRWWINQGLYMIKGPNMAAWIFCMKNIFGWRDKKDIDVGSKKENPLMINANLDHLNVEQLEALKKTLYVNSEREVS